MPNMSMPKAIQLRNAAKQTLETQGIRARFAICLGDTGLRVEVYVAPRDFPQALPALNGLGNSSLRLITEP